MIHDGPVARIYICIIVPCNVLLLLMPLLRHAGLLFFFICILNPPSSHLHERPLMWSYITLWGRGGNFSVLHENLFPSAQNKSVQELSRTRTYLLGYSCGQGGLKFFNFLFWWIFKMLFIWISPENSRFYVSRGSIDFVHLRVLFKRWVLKASDRTL